LKKYIELLEERSTLNQAKQQIYSIDKNANVSEITNKINKLSEEIRELDFNNIIHETHIIGENDIKEENKIKNIEEFKELREDLIISKINESISNIDEIPSTFAAILRYLVLEHKRMIINHNYNVYLSNLE